MANISTDLVTIETRSNQVPQTIDYDTRLRMLTPDEKKALSVITEKIDEHDLATVHDVGAELNATISSSSRKILDAAKKQEVNAEAITLANELLATLNEIDLGEINTKSKVKRILRKIPFLKKTVTSVETAIMQWDTDTKGKVDQMVEKFQAGKLIAQADNTNLQEMRDQSIQVLMRIRQVILALKLKEEQFKEKLAEMEANRDQYEFYELQDMADCIHAISKRIVDLEVNEDIIKKGVYQIKAIQTNNDAIVDNYKNMCGNLIPVWEHQMAMAINIAHQKKNLEVQKKYKEKMNELLVKNAEELKENSIQAAHASEESMIDIETIQSTTNDLIETIKTVTTIYNQAEENRKQYEKAIQDFSHKLDNEVRNTQRK